MKKLRVGVIGAGYLGTYHIQKYSQMEGVDLVGVVDIDRSKAEVAAVGAKSTAYQNYKDLFEKVDAVSIVVPTLDHYRVAKDFLAKGIDVLIEKPMTTTLEEADELIQFSEAKGLILQVGHLERFNPAVVALRDVVGKPMFIESHRLSIFKNRGTDVSVVLDLMIHDIDIILNFVRSDVVDIRAAGIPVISETIDIADARPEHIDIANARLEFKSGCVANVTASRISTKSERKIRLFQKDAYISVDFANKGITIINRDVTADHGLIPGMDIKQFSFAESDALKDELKSFVNAVKNRDTPEVTGQMGRDALQIALNIMRQITDTSNRILS